MTIRRDNPFLLAAFGFAATVAVMGAVPATGGTRIVATAVR